MMHEKRFGQKLRKWKFSSFDWSSIDQIPIESGREQWLKIKGFSIGRKTHSIYRNSGKLDFFEKQQKFYAENTQSKEFHEWNTWEWV